MPKKPPSKLSKEDVGYSRGMVNSHCGRVFHNDSHFCQHFTPKSKSALDDGECEIVAGEINPIFWCERFKKVKIQ